MMLRPSLDFCGLFAGGPPMEERDELSVFLHRDCMFSSKCIVTLTALMLAITMPAAHAQQTGAVYEAQRGDCLYGIVKAHYPDVTGHFFVLHSNPAIVDENQIEVGQAIILPGLSAEQILPGVDQTGCNAASLAARKATKSTITEKAGDVAGTRTNSKSVTAPTETKPVVEKRPPAMPAVPKIAATAAVNAAAGVTSTGVEAATSAIPVQSQAKMDPVIPAAVAQPPRKRPTDERPSRQPVVVGTRAVPVDESQRTVAVRARGRATRASAPMQSKPQFAVDEELTLPSHSYRQSTPNRYVVNAIGARTLSAPTALVQHPDQHFYVESRAEWQQTMSGHALTPSNAAPTPASDPVSKTTTPLEEALARREKPKTQRAGNIFIDESLLLKAAAKPGDNP